MDPAALFSRRHALDAMTAGFVIERFDALPYYLKAKAAQVQSMPAFALAHALVSAEQI